MRQEKQKKRGGEKAKLTQESRIFAFCPCHEKKNEARKAKKEGRRESKINSRI